MRDGRDIVSIHISGGISGTVEAARQAAAELAGVRARASRSSTRSSPAARSAWSCSPPSRRRARGADVEAVAARAREAAGATRLWFAVDTLEYLQRGGRIGAAQAWLGGALKIKPILTFDGEIVPIERVRTSGRAFERMVHYLQSRHDDGADGWVIQHIQAPDVCERLVASGREIFGSEPLFVSEIGPVIGAHAGPGLSASAASRWGCCGSALGLPRGVCGAARPGTEGGWSSGEWRAPGRADDRAPLPRCRAASAAEQGGARPTAAGRPGG